MVLLVDELQQVAVAGDDDQHAQVAPRAAGAGQAADHVVGLVARPLLDRDVQGVDQLAHPHHLRAQIVRHGAAVRLVLGELLVAKRRPALHGDDGVFGLLAAEDVEQHRGEAEDGVDDFALRGRDLVLDRVVGAKDQPIAVDEEHRRLLGGGRWRLGWCCAGHSGNLLVWTKYG